MNLTKTSLALAALLAAAAPAVAAPLTDSLAVLVTADPYALRLQLVWLCAAVAAGVYAIMVYGLLTSRRPGGAAAGRQRLARAELLWAVIPAVIVIGLALPAVDSLAELAAGAPPAAVAADLPAGP
jgi:heme/copper-type cytochrome/quinol oxidase subunit 2